jgi:transposase-like protein
MIEKATEFKQKRIADKNKLKEIEIGNGNIKCNYCHEIKLTERFRHNRLKCKDCEREEPISKIIRSVRSRILSAIKNKSKHTIDYLGCNCSDYLKWLLNNNSCYIFENYGKEWHIDHVIPISKFDIMNEDQQLIAFNWRNTMPLSVKENLSKNNKIIKEQVEQHYKKLLDYHLENKLDLPQVYIDLFAKYLVAGSPLEPI